MASLETNVRAAGRDTMGRFMAAVDRNAFATATAALCAAGALAAVRGVLQSDAWLTLLAGRVVARDGLPRRETLVALGRGVRWVDQQWLGQVAFYELWRLGGIRLAMIATVVLFLAAGLLALGAAVRAGASSTAAVLVAGPCFVVGLQTMVMRTQAIALVLFALLLLLLLDEARAPGRRVLAVFPLLALWANIHGSVVLGALLVSLLGLFRLAGGVAPKTVALVAAPWACLFASPYAPHLVGYYRDVLGNPAFAKLVLEWRPSTIRTEPVFFAVALVALALVARYGSSLLAYERVVFALALVGGLAAVRNVVWFALVTAALLPRVVDAAWRPGAAPRRRRLNVAIVAACVAVSVTIAAAVLARPAGWYTASFPPAAARVVARAAGGGGAVFADERYADWLLWTHPELSGRVAYDARFELLTAAQLDAVAAFWSRSGADWTATARGYRLVVAHTRDAHVLRELEQGLPARVIYREGDVVVLERRA